jgi:hypothetical protein
MGRKWADNFTTNLASTINSTAQTLSVSTGTGTNAPTITGRGTPGSCPDYFVLTIEDDVGNREKIRVEHHGAGSDVFGSVGFPLIRGYDGSTAQSWTAGSNVSVDIRVDKSFLSDAQNRIGAISSATVFGPRDAGTSGLVYGYFGGQLSVDGVNTSISDGSVTLTASQTNYVERDQSGTVSFNTTGFSADKFPIAEVVTNSTDITSITDRRYINVELAGLVSKSVAGSADVTLTAAESRAGIIELTGAIAANINVILPMVKRRFVVTNKTTGSFSLTVKGATGTGISVVQGSSAIVYFDGTNFRSATGAGSAIGASDFQTQIYSAFTTSGTSTAYALTPTPAITANAVGQRFRVKFHTSAGATPTLSVSGQAALNLKFKDGSGVKQAVTSIQIPTGWMSDVEGDGTDWVLLDIPPSTVMPQNSKSTAYTTVLSDAGKHLLHPSADTTARVFTIDSNANVPYDVGTAITFVNQNAAGVITISINADTMRLAGIGTTGSRTLAANGIATALKVTATEWIISGTGLT